MDNKEMICIDCTTINKKYDKQTISEICAWASVSLHHHQKSKWYNWLNPFKHFYPSDYDVLMKIYDKMNEV